VSRHRPGPLTPEVNSASGHVRNRHPADGYPEDGQAYQVTPYNVAETTPQPAVPDSASTRKVEVRRVTLPPGLREVDRRDRGEVARRDRGEVAGREEAEPRASRRITRQRRSVIHRLGTTGQVGAAAVIFVAAVAVAVYFVAPGSSGAGGAAAFEAISNSNTLTALEKERQEIVDMNAAAQTMSVTGKMKVVSPSQVVESEQEASEQSTSQDDETSDAPTEPTGPTPDPGSAEAIGYDLLPSYGFSQSTQWGCLYNLWMRESGWVYDAENASGAYGIPQSLPASKMASAGSDYLTDPRTQIIWGLGYIQSTYGTPCDAWDFEEANGYY
jgi:hypothetical protein